MARYGIVARKAYGVPMGRMLALAKRIGRDHDLALALWDSGVHDARMLASMVDEPARVTRRQMDVWADGFENWAQCDTVCMRLFDKTPYASEKAKEWAARPRTYVKRGGFALMAAMAVHDKAAADAAFRPFFAPIRRAAYDGRDIVRKGVSWALRSIGQRSTALHGRALTLARSLAAAKHPGARWVGKDVVRDLERPLVRARLPRRERKRGTRRS